MLHAHKGPCVKGSVLSLKPLGERTLREESVGGAKSLQVFGLNPKYPPTTQAHVLNALFPDGGIILVVELLGEGIQLVEGH